MTSNTQHTPGPSMAAYAPQPWIVNGSYTTAASWVEDAEGRRVCTMRIGPGDLDCARLIASAPALLAALKHLDECLARIPGFVGNGEYTMAPAIENARAAIAAAEGR